MAAPQNSTAQPHKGTYGLCAPPSVAGDQRAMIERPYATVAFSLYQTAGAYVAHVDADPNAWPVPILEVVGIEVPTFTPMRGNTSTTDGAYVVGTAGIGERGTDCGIADPLTRAETSFFTEGYPFRDYEFVLRGLSIVPDGKPFRAASVSSVNGSVSIGGDALTNGRVASVIDGLSSEIADSVVSSFFQTMSAQLGFKSESAKWDLATPLFHPGGLGLTGSSTPTNASPIGGKTLTLPFDVQLPRANHRGVSVAQIIFRQEQATVVAGSGTRAKQDFSTKLYFSADAGTDSLALVQKFKVILIGERACVADSLDARLQRLAAQHGCSIEQARAIAADVSKTP